MIVWDEFRRLKAGMMIRYHEIWYTCTWDWVHPQRVAKVRYRMGHKSVGTSWYKPKGVHTPVYDMGNQLPIVQAVSY